MKILLHGLYGRSNVGDEFVCHATIEGLRRSLPREGQIFEFIALSTRPRASQDFDPDSKVKFVKEGTIHPIVFPVLRSVCEISKVDVDIAGGGGLVKDMYSWSLSFHTLLYQSIAVAFGKKAYCCNIGVGPLNSR